MPRARTLLVYAPSGNAKTSQALYIAKWVYENFGKTTRMISADGGGWQSVQPMIDTGIIDAVNIVGEPFALATVRKLSCGFWKKKRQYKAAPGIVPAEPIWKEDFIRSPASEMAKVGCYFIEGLTSISDLWLDHISKSEDKVMFESAAYVEDGEVFRSSDKGHYNLVQTQLYSVVQSFGALPVELVVWTALVGKAEEKFTKESQYGPKLAGGAKTLIAPSWMGDCLHIQDTNESKENDLGVMTEERKLRAYFIPHRDPDTNIKYLAKPRVSPVLMPKLLKAFPGGYVDLTLPTEANPFGSGLDRYLNTIETLKAGDAEVFKAWKESREPKTV